MKTVILVNVGLLFSFIIYLGLEYQMDLYKNNELESLKLESQMLERDMDDYIETKDKDVTLHIGEIKSISSIDNDNITYLDLDYGKRKVNISIEGENYIMIFDMKNTNNKHLNLKEHGLIYILSDNEYNFMHNPIGIYSNYNDTLEKLKTIKVKSKKQKDKIINRYLKLKHDVEDYNTNFNTNYVIIKRKHIIYDEKPLIKNHYQDYYFEIFDELYKN